MAEDSIFDREKETLGKCVRSQHRYGTASKSSYTPSNPSHFIKHEVRLNDTLAGIALKYGSSVSGCGFFLLFKASLR